MPSTIWKGTIVFGETAIPVTLSSAARAENIECSQVHASDGSPVRQVLFCQSENKLIGRNEVAKVIEHAGHRLSVEDTDFDQAKPGTAKTVHLIAFVQDIDPLFVRDHYHVFPDGPDERAYATLYSALKKSGRTGLVKITMYRREHLAAVHAGKFGLILHTLYHAAEVRSLQEFRTNTEIVEEKELKGALRLIRRGAAAFEPETFTDAFRENFMKILASKPIPVPTSGSTGTGFTIPTSGSTGAASS